MRTLPCCWVILLFLLCPIHAWWSSGKNKSSFSNKFNDDSDNEEEPTAANKILGARHEGVRFMNKEKTLDQQDDSDEESRNNNIGGRSYSGSRTATSWWQTAVSILPRIRCSVEPSTSLKLKKHFRFLQRPMWVGAEYQAQNNVWRLQTSCDDHLLGGTILFTGRELQFHKSWEYAPLPDVLTRLRLRTSVDLTGNASIFLGFGTDQITAISNGLGVRKRFPVDKNGNVKLEVKAKVVLPTPEIEFSTRTSRSVVGVTDVELTVEELNLLLEY